MIREETRVDAHVLLSLATPELKQRPGDVPVEFGDVYEAWFQTFDCSFKDLKREAPSFDFIKFYPTIY